ncbi:MAG: HD domain-containing protein [Elusimicrobium sp.]|jgi:putative nucleotidyltransferase with HDIG domain|nr:HD domain-containing protein [Elusimicrobium sp.]
MTGIAAALAGIENGFYVGGCVRDSVLKRPSADIDVALPVANIKAEAFTLAKKLDANVFEMDAQFGVWRLITRKEKLQIDLTAFQGKNLEEDLKRRDFTVNSLALPTIAKPEIKIKTIDGKNYFLLSIKPKEIIDLAGGLKDLKSKTIRSNGAKVFEDDPLRTLRALRASAELNFKIDKQTLAQVKKYSRLITQSAPERIREELIRVFNCRGVRKNLEILDAAGLLNALFPVLKDQKKCARVYYGKGGVFEHTLMTAGRMEYLLENLKTVYPAFYKKIEPYAKDAALYKMTALLHDIAKPATAKKTGGRLRFFFHEEQGACMAEEILKNLRYSTSEIRLICAMIHHHLRPSNLASNDVITDRGLFKFFRGMQDAAVPLLLLCWADYASYVTDAQLKKILPLSSKPVMTIDEAKAKSNVSKTLRHMQVLNFMFKKYFADRATINPQKLINGSDVMSVLQIPSGPRVGELLEKVTLAQVDGKIKTKEDALKFLKQIKP